MQHGELQFSKNNIYSNFIIELLFAFRISYDVIRLFGLEFLIFFLWLSDIKFF